MKRRSRRSREHNTERLQQVIGSAFRKNSRNLPLDRQLEYAVASRLKAAGATTTEWGWGDFCQLAEDLGCSVDLLAVAVGCTSMQIKLRKRMFRRWQVQDKLPGPVALTCAIIRQFVDFQATGVLSPPIIPLDVMMQRRRTRENREKQETTPGNPENP